MRFGVIGGDARQAALRALLRERGADVVTYGLAGEDGDREAALGADILLLPLPLTKECGRLNCETDPMELSRLFARLRPDQWIFAGQVRDADRRLAAEYGLTIRDYFLREELTVANAAITADCAIQLAREHLGDPLPPALVLGFGRIGKFLCHRLQHLGVPVTAAARKPEDMAWAAGYGYEAADIRALSGHLAPFGLVFNTVPAMVLPERLASELAPETLCIDLASCRGVERETCLWARGLPGKMAPQAAGQAILTAVEHILSEERGETI